MQPDQQVFEVLAANPLFAGIEKADVVNILSCCRAQMCDYPKGKLLIDEDSIISSIGILISGRAQAYKSDASGRRLVVAELEPGSLYGDVLSASVAHKSPVAVVATEYTQAVYLPYERLITRCAKACPNHDILLKNLLYIISGKFFELHERINCIIRPTLREKILFFLENSRKQQGSANFSIPFDRSAMAEYLNADRSALSRELAKLKREGLIDYYKNSFRLLGGDH